MTLSGRHSEVRAGVGLDPMLLGGCNHLGPRVGPPLLKLVPCLPVDSKPFLAAVGGTRSGATRFTHRAQMFWPFWPGAWACHAPKGLCGGNGLRPASHCGLQERTLGDCLPSQHHGQRRPPPPRWLPSLGDDPCVGAMGVGWGRGRWVWTCRKRGAGQGWVAGQPASSRRLQGVGVW